MAWTEPSSDGPASSGDPRPLLDPFEPLVRRIADLEQRVRELEVRVDRDDDIQRERIERE